MIHLFQLRLARPGLIASGLLALAIGTAVLAQEKPEWTKEDVRKKLIEDAYIEHDRNVRAALPQYSSMPPILDLTGRSLADGTCDANQHAKWEARFVGIMGSEPLSDPGITIPKEATSVALTTSDGEGPIYALPARLCSRIVIARPVSEVVCVSQSRRYVYTRFRLEISKELKRPKHESNEGGQIEAVQFGGSIRFPSGHLMTLLLDQRGFLSRDKHYVLFLWKPIRSDETYVAPQAYLIQNGFVFPVSASAPNAFHYTKMPLKDFEARVKAAVAKNIDRD